MVIDKEGFRANVGIVLINNKRQVLLCKRVGLADAWQFPQGGIHQGESVTQAMYRELTEELGLRQDDVAVLAESKNWLRYWLPKHLRRYHVKPLCVGQKQKWFLLRLLSSEASILFTMTDHPEFDEGAWVDYWYPAQKVIAFKRRVYKKMLQEFESVIFET